MENKMYTKPQWKCGICGKIFDEIKERNKCEMACIKQQEEEAKKAAELQQKKQKAARQAETDELVKKAIDSIKAFQKDYGYYELNSSGDEYDFVWPSKLWHYFFD